MYWASWVWANYTPSWCYGHDEPTMSFVSNSPGSGEDANYSFILPADGTYTQGDFYATIWMGGVVYDPSSLDSQAYLEFQFYPAPPEYTGPGNGTLDCLPNGAFYPNYSPGSNDWFACAIVWQVVGSSESAAFAGPLDLQGTSSIFVLHSNDQVYLNETGVAKSGSQPWLLAVTDSTLHSTGTVTLQNGTVALPPYYSTAAAGNVLAWGASLPGAIAMAYEVGHSLNPAIPEGGSYGACYPGDGACDSYWPGLWAESGQPQLSLPLMGQSGSQTYPTEIALGSSVEGENWVNGTISNDLSTCGAPSWSTGTNCLYPWYTYRAQDYSFTFGANNATNTTHNYGFWYQFPGASQTVRYHPAPWGLLDSTVTPSFVRVEFNPLHGTNVVPVLPNGTVDRQFLEGPYWLNVSYPGCVTSSTYVYLGTGAVYRTPIQLSCPGLYNVTFTESGLAAGTPWSVTLGATTFQSFGPTISFYVPNGTQSFSVLSPAPGTPGVRYLATPTNGSVDVLAAPLTKSVSYATEFELTGVASPATAASIQPGLEWAAPGTVLQVTALPGPSWVFVLWRGIGDGSYSGAANPAPVVMNGPVQEAAFFYFLYTVSFTETGLPTHASWGVDLNGNFQASTSSAIDFQMPNGSYTYNITGPSGYTLNSSAGSGSVQGSDVNVAVPFMAIVAFGLTAVELDLLALVVAAIAIAVGVNVVYWWTHRKRPPAPPPPSVPPPSWLGPPPSR